MVENSLSFIATIGLQKAKIRQRCPFCNVADLRDVIDSQGEKILLKNKYTTLENTEQLVLIESDRHDGDVSNYGKQEWVAILQYAIDNWEALLKSEAYRSVLLYKNFGPESGGSQEHPHMQLIGLKNIAGYTEIRKKNFIGIKLAAQSGVTVNISEFPIMGFLEINVIWRTDNQLRIAAEEIQNVVSYLLNQYYQGRCQSYNLFFYKSDARYICKIVPRFTASPYFVGYKIAQTFNADYVAFIKQEYLAYCNNR